jgi:hypothetical protein
VEGVAKGFDIFLAKEEVQRIFSDDLVPASAATPPLALAASAPAASPPCCSSGCRV